MVPPELLDELVDGHDAAGACDEAGKDRPLLRSGYRQRLPAYLSDFEGSEHEEAHKRRLTPVTDPIQTLLGPVGRAYC